MQVDLVSDFPVTDEACKATTGKTFGQWIATIDARGIGKGRREVIQWLYDETGRGKDVWWATTIWVEYERSKGVVVKKDGLAEGYNICVTKSVSAPVAAAFSAFSSVVESCGNAAVLLRVREDKDLRFSWQTSGVPDKTLVDVTFLDSGKGKTAIAIMHTRIQTRAESDGLRNAWTKVLNDLKARVEA